MHVINKKKSKLDPKFDKCIFIGFFLNKKNIDVSTLPLESYK